MHKHVASGPGRFCAPRGSCVLFPTGLLILATWIIAGVLTYGQVVERWIDDPRPLSQAIDILREQCRCVITYEDPQYEATQVVDVTQQVSRSPGSTNRVLVPRGTPFVFANKPLAAAKGPEDVVAASEALLDQFHHSGNPTRFRLDRSDTVLHVVPVKGSIL
jgi:hypothetical protein